MTDADNGRGFLNSCATLKIRVIRV